jgi:hypothetical protein
MKKLAQKLGFNLFIISIIPLAYLIDIALKKIGVESDIITLIVLPFVIIQALALYMIIRYNKPPKP